MSKRAFYGLRPQDADIGLAATWLLSIGLQLQWVKDVPKDCFVPGIKLVNGMLLVHKETAFVGDLLHEAGHIAICPGKLRDHLSGDLDKIPGWEELIQENLQSDDAQLQQAILQMGEDEVIAWSYAAAIAAGIQPEFAVQRIVGLDFDGNSERIGYDTHLGLSMGMHFGVNGLRAAGFLNNTKDCPRLTRWMQL